MKIRMFLGICGYVTLILSAESSALAGFIDHPIFEKGWKVENLVFSKVYSSSQGVSADKAVDECKKMSDGLASLPTREQALFYILDRKNSNYSGNYLWTSTPETSGFAVYLDSSEVMDWVFGTSLQPFRCVIDENQPNYEAKLDAWVKAHSKSTATLPVETLPRKEKELWFCAGSTEACVKIQSETFELHRNQSFENVIKANPRQTRQISPNLERTYVILGKYDGQIFADIAHWMETGEIKHGLIQNGKIASSYAKSFGLTKLVEQIWKEAVHCKEGYILIEGKETDHFSVADFCLSKDGFRPMTFSEARKFCEIEGAEILHNLQWQILVENIASLESNWSVREYSTITGERSSLTYLTGPEYSVISRQKNLRYLTTVTGLKEDHWVQTDLIDLKGMWKTDFSLGDLNVFSPTRDRDIATKLKYFFGPGDNRRLWSERFIIPRTTISPSSASTIFSRAIRGDLEYGGLKTRFISDDNETEESHVRCSYVPML